MQLFEFQRLRKRFSLCLIKKNEVDLRSLVQVGEFGIKEL